MLAVILKSKRTVALVAIAAMAIALLTGWNASKFKSEGYFQLGMSFPEYKRLQASIAAPHRWANFAKTRSAAEVAPFAGITQILNDSKKLQNLIEPIYPVTKAELKQLPDAASKDDTANSISGLRISFQAADPGTAQHCVRVLGEFVRDTAILMDYRDSIHARHTEYLNRQKKYENSVIDAKYQLEQVEIKRDAMQKILHSYPESAKADNRQLVSIAEGGERYLSPVTQLVALESQIADINQSLPKIVRDQRINSIYLAYSDKVSSLADKSTSGDAFLKALPGIKDSLNLDLADAVEKSVYNAIAMNDINAHSRYFEKTRFIAEPILSKHRSPSLSLMAVLGLMLGALLGCAYVLLRDFSGSRNSSQAARRQDESKIYAAQRL